MRREHVYVLVRLPILFGPKRQQESIDNLHNIQTLMSRNTTEEYNEEYSDGIATNGNLSHRLNGNTSLC